MSGNNDCFSNARVSIIRACLLLFSSLVSTSAYALDCGTPNWSRHTDVGVFIWQSCTSDRYEVRITAGGMSNAVVYSGHVAAETPFVGGINTISQENSDTFITSDLAQIDYALKTSSPWYDGFNFKLAASGSGCFTVDWNRSGLPPIYAGPNRTVVVSPFDLETLGPCQGAPIRLDVSGITVSEADTEAVFTINLSSASDVEVSVEVATADGTALFASDYQSVSTFLTFLPGETIQTVSVPLLQDDLSEGPERFSLILSNPVNALLGTASAQATIQDDEINICGEPAWNRQTDTGVILWQDCSTQEWQVRVASAAISSRVTFNGNILSDLPLTHATAINQEANDVFDLSDPQQLVFGLINRAPWWDGFRFAVTTGSLSCFEVAPSSPGGGTVLVGPDKTPLTAPFSLNTLGGCQAPPGQISVSDVTVSEADTDTVFTLNLSSASDVAVSVDVATVDGSATAGNDYTAITATIAFAPGEISQTVAVPILNDIENENPETFSLVLSNPIDGVINGDTATATINDDEISTCGQPDLNTTTNEGMFVWQDCSQADHWHLRYLSSSSATLNASLISDAAYLSVTPVGLEGQGQLTTSLPQHIELQLIGDSTPDGVDIITTPGAALCLDASTVYYGAAETVAVTPLDLNTLSSCLVIKPTATTLSVSEADAEVILTVRLSAESTDVVTVNYQTIDGTAQSNADYVPITGTVIFQPTVTVQTITVPLLQDLLSEAIEDFTITLSNAGNAYLANPVTTISIMDDEIDTCGAPSYNTATKKALFIWKECQTGTWFVRNTGGGDSSGVFYTGEISHDQGFINVTGFSLEASDTLDNVTDPTVITYLLKVWNAGEDGFQFTPVSDAGTCVELFGPAGVPVLVGPSQQPVSGAFDVSTLGPCQAPPVRINVSDVTVSEADTEAVFTVSLSAVSLDEITVIAATADGTALASSDYQAVSTTLTFMPGETEHTVAIPLIQDSLSEGTERFTVILSQPVNALPGDASGEAIILDDEISPCGEPNVNKQNEYGLFLWQDCSGDQSWHVLAAAGGQSAPVRFKGSIDSDIPAISIGSSSYENSDILDTSNPLSIYYDMKVSSGGIDKLNFRYPDIANVCFDANAPAGVPVYIGVDRSSVTLPLHLGLLASCDALGIQIIDVDVSEAAGLLSIPVTLSEPSSEVVTLDYTSNSGSASAGSDYTHVSGSFTFAPGVTEQIIEIPVLQDADVEGPENFTLVLSDIVNAFSLRASLLIHQNPV